MTGIKMIFEDLVDCDPIDDYLEAALARESSVHQEWLNLVTMIVNSNKLSLLYSDIEISTYISRMGREGWNYKYLEEKLVNHS